MKKTIYNTKLITKRHPQSLATGVVAGLASLLTVSSSRPRTMRRTIESSTKALRGDFVRIGMDMRKAAAEVIRREKTSG